LVSRTTLLGSAVAFTTVGARAFPAPHPSPCARRLPGGVIRFAYADSARAELEHRRTVTGPYQPAPGRLAKLIDLAPLAKRQDAIAVCGKVAFLAFGPVLARFGGFAACSPLGEVLQSHGKVFRRLATNQQRPGEHRSSCCAPGPSGPFDCWAPRLRRARPPHQGLDLLSGASISRRPTTVLCHLEGPGCWPTRPTT
jgi:hypothetical protein